MEAVDLVPQRTAEIKSRIIPRDEALLVWFFGQGQSVFERSTFGAILERQEHFGNKTKPCGRCKGIGFTDDDVKRATVALKAIEHMRKTDWERYQQLSQKLGPTCSECLLGCVPDGRVGAPKAMRSHCHICSGTGRDEYQGQPCWRCDGSGMRDGYDVSENEDESEASYTPDEWALQRYAVASRHLGRISPKHGNVLEAFFGPAGQRCGAGDPRSPKTPPPGRLAAIYPLTTAGRKWLKTLPNPLELPSYDLLAGQVTIQYSQPQSSRYERLAECRRQAETMLDAACQAWNRAVKKHGASWREEADLVMTTIRKRVAANG